MAENKKREHALVEMKEAMAEVKNRLPTYSDEQLINLYAKSISEIMLFACCKEDELNAAGIKVLEELNDAIKEERARRKLKEVVE
jgi:hypothetical protein